MRLFLILSFILILFKICPAGKLTVDNKHPYIAQFTNLSEAQVAASPGDTIYVYPSLAPYGGISVTKKLTFIGVGYDLNETASNPYTPSSIITTMNFQSGSEGSWLEGFDGLFGVTINTNNVTLKRNKLLYVYLDNGSGSVIIQNKIIGRGTNIGYSSYYSIYTTQSPNILVANNIIINPNSSTSYDNAIGGISGSLVINNVIKAPAYCLSGSDNEVVNNIFILGGLSDNLYRYNMYYAGSNYLTQGFGNIQNIDMNTVFVDHENYNYHLLTSSPAMAAGEYGTDMGIYGGDTPYIDSGFPGLPSILQILAPTVGSQQNGLDIQFKAKSNKE